ncbi:hypothetical protein FSP39_001801, partial [Pinctada imbricata]
IIMYFYFIVELKLVTIATDNTDGLRRYLHSVSHYDLDTEVYGMGVQWDGGNVAVEAGGGQKVNILVEGLKEYEGREDVILMFTDSYDAVLTAGKEEILQKFQKFDARVVFSAEGFCWPDESLKVQYPEVKFHEKRFLNSGGFIGYAKDIYEIVTYKDIGNQDDDQLYYTKIYLDESLREKWQIKLDTKSEIFQNLNGALADVTIKYKSDHSYLYNFKTGTTPIPEFNRIANYLVDGWTTSSGCLSCKRDTISLEGMKDDDLPTILLALFIEFPTPFIEEYLERVSKLNYPKSRMDLFIHNKEDYHSKDLAAFLEKYNDEYRSTTVLSPSDGLSEANARTWAIEEGTKKLSQYFFNVDSNIQIEDPNTLRDLIEQNRTIIAPITVRPYKLWSNFWGAVTKTGWYARSEDYMNIVEYKLKGLWNVPYISGIYLIQGSLMPSLSRVYYYHHMDADMSFATNVRKMGIFMFATNMKKFGHLVDVENFDTSHLHNDMYQIFQNPWDWEEKYIHEDYSKSLQEDTVIDQPCQDVYWFPIVSDVFCKQLIEEMEKLNQWSGGRHEDPRLSGGYENVPTVDTHMKQIGMEDEWLQFLKNYVRPLQEKVFIGYYHNPPRAIMNFVVRYRPNEQDRLRPHHDSSTFTINIALNTPGIDFEGGGCRFIRYNCSVTATRRGWMLMHPGRLTHYHEGLVVTKGTRYIMISFIDP